MKKLFPIFLMAILITVASCSNDEETPSYAKADFLGEWVLVETTIEDREVSTGDCFDFISFSEDEISEGTDCSGARSSASYAYEYDNKNAMTYEIFGISGKWVIVELSDTRLKLDVYAEGMKFGTSTYEKQ